MRVPRRLPILAAALACAAAAAALGAIPALAAPAAPAATAAAGAAARVSPGTLTATAARQPQTGVVVIETDLGYQDSSAAGTGIVVTASGRVLTNNHVIRGATTIRVIVPATGRSYPARVLGYAVSADVAVLQLAGASGLDTVALGSSAGLAVGQSVTAVGNAGGTGAIVTATGSIVALGRTITASDENGLSQQMTGLIQTDAELQPGDSGGPLLDSAGRVIGMDSAASPSYSFRGVAAEGYAIPIAGVLELTRQIVAGKGSATVHIGPTAFLGVSVAPLDGYRGAAAGVAISALVSGGPAERAGLTVGDVIVALDGRTITSSADVVAHMQAKKPGQLLKVVWSGSDGRQASATVRLGSGPPQ